MLPSGLTFRYLVPKGALDKFGTHAQESSHNHPESRAGTAQGNSNGYACNVADTHGPRQGGRERLEVTDLSFVVGVVKFAANDIQGMAKGGDVHKAVVQREDQGPRQQPNEHKRHLSAAPNGHREENDAHDGIGDGLHDRIDAVVDAVLSMRQNGQARQQEKGETLDHKSGLNQT